MRKILSGTFAVMLFAAFAFEGAADAAKGRSRSAPKAAKKSAPKAKAAKAPKAKKAFKGFGAAKKPAGFRQALNKRKGKKGSGFGGMISKSKVKRQKATGKLGKVAKKAKGGAKLGGAKKFAKSAKGLKKFSKFKKFGSKMMKPGAMKGLIGKFKGAAKKGGLRGGPFSLAGKMMKGRTGLTAPFKKFFGSSRAGQWNKMRGMLGHIKNRGGKGLGKVATFARNFGAKFKQTATKIKSKVGGAFNKIKNSPLFKKLAPAAKAAFSKLIESAKAEAVGGATAEAEQMGTAAVETATEGAVAEVDPAAAEVAQADPGVPAQVSESGEAVDAPAAEATAPAEAQEAVTEAAQEAGAPAPEPESQNIPAADAPVEDAPAEQAAPAVE